MAMLSQGFEIDIVCPYFGDVVVPDIQYDKIQCVFVRARFETVEEAESFASFFPKSIGLWVSALTIYGEAGRRVERTVGMDLNFHATEVTGAKNETAWKRLSSLVKHAKRLNVPLTQKRMFANSAVEGVEFYLQQESK